MEGIYNYKLKEFGEEEIPIEGKRTVSGIVDEMAIYLVRVQSSKKGRKIETKARIEHAELIREPFS